MKLEFSPKIFEKPQIPNFKKIRPVGVELFHVDGRTDRRDETNLRVAFSNAKGPNNCATQTRCLWS